jgi:DNA repair ATPase RecN
MLKSLHLRHVGPAPQLDVEFADRLNIITGANGLGKSFLLDVAWWAITGAWADQFALPRREDPE